MLVGRSTDVRYGGRPIVLLPSFRMEKPPPDIGESKYATILPYAYTTRRIEFGGSSVHVWWMIDAWSIEFR